MTWLAEPSFSDNATVMIASFLEFILVEQASRKTVTCLPKIYMWAAKKLVALPICINPVFHLSTGTRSAGGTIFKRIVIITNEDLWLEWLFSCH